MKIRFAFMLVLVGFVATVSSCSQRSLSPLLPCTINGVVQNVPVNPQRALDLLILIDDSPSMRDEQEKLAEQVPRLVNILLTGGEGTDAVDDFPPIESLHVAVITPDLGYSTDPPYPDPPPYEVGVDFNPTQQCTNKGFSGLDGFMQTTGLIDDDGDPGTPRVQCDAQPDSETPYLDRPPTADPSFDAQFVSDVECITGQTDGCGFEQQLEALLRQDLNPGNLGFSREDALLAVIMITDEDDCSTTDPRVFDVEGLPANPYPGPFTSENAEPPNALQFNLRCWEHKEQLQAIERYVQRIADLKQDPSQVVFAAITGIPEDGDLEGIAGAATEVDRYDVILNDDDMVEVPDPAADDQQGQQLRPACTATDGSGSAAPARRIVETMKGLAEDNSGVGTVVESICAADYAPALDAIIDRIAAALRQLCLPRALNRNSANLVGCEVREVQPEGQSCDPGRGREPLNIQEDGREVCRVTQLPSDPAAGVPDGLGWFYDDFTPETQSACSFNPEQQRVSFTEEAAPQSGARIRFECLQTAPPQDVDIGWPCTGNADCTVDPGVLEERYDRQNLELVCDTTSNTCQLTCESTAQCPGGYVCFDATDDDVDDAYCVNPTCQLN